MQVIGQYDCRGIYARYIQPCEVVQIGNRLIDKEDGIVIGVMDDYGDWVSATLHALGVKSKLEVVAT